MIIIQLIITLYSIILHEIAHGWMANQLGDPTAKKSGRLTLNPLPHIDPILTVILPLTLLLAGSSIVFGAARPVPINARKLKNPRRDVVLVSLSGPAVNLLIALTAALMTKIVTFLAVGNGGSWIPIGQITYFTTYINVLLGIVNLIPVPPLDGSKLFGLILPDTFLTFWYRLENIGLFVIVGGFILYGSAISSFLTSSVGTVTNILLSANSI